MVGRAGSFPPCSPVAVMGVTMSPLGHAKDTLGHVSHMLGHAKVMLSAYKVGGGLQVGGPRRQLSSLQPCCRHGWHDELAGTR